MDSRKGSTRCQAVRLIPCSDSVATVLKFLGEPMIYTVCRLKDSGRLCGVIDREKLHSSTRQRSTHVQVLTACTV